MNRDRQHQLGYSTIKESRSGDALLRIAAILCLILGAVMAGVSIAIVSVEISQGSVDGCAAFIGPVGIVLCVSGSMILSRRPGTSNDDRPRLRRLRPLLIYLPSIALLIVTILLPQFGPNVVGKRNAHEFFLIITFWYTAAAFAVHLSISVFRR